MELAIADVFEVIADAVPDRQALIGGTTRLTYGELDGRSNRVAHFLLREGVAPGDYVGILSRNRVEWLEVMLGCFKARAVPINLNYRYVAPELSYVARNAGLVGIVHERSFSGLVEESCAALPLMKRRLVLEDGAPGSQFSYEHVLNGSSHSRDGLPACSGDDLYVLYTGGTTGMPKGVLWRQEDFFLGPLGGSSRRGGPIRTAEDAIRQIPAHEDRQTALVVPPLMHGTGQWTSLSPLLAGSSVILYTKPHFDPKEVLQLVKHEQVTVLVLVGDVMARPLVEILRNGHTADADSLAVILTSGAPLSDQTRDDLCSLMPHLRIINRLGSSESGTLGVASDKGAGSSRTGRFSISDDTSVLDQNLLPLTPGDGTVGRLARRGHIPIGYHGDPEKTAATFVLDRDGVRWVLPGDFATVLIDGSITMLGRGSTTINSGGEKIYPIEVEAALKTHPAVLNAIVIGIPDDRFGERVAAVVQEKDGASIVEDDLVEHCRALVAGYKVPRFVLFVDNIPLTAMGKPDHVEARNLVLAASPQ